MRQKHVLVLAVLIVLAVLVAWFLPRRAPRSTPSSGAPAGPAAEEVQRSPAALDPLPDPDDASRRASVEQAEEARKADPEAARVLVVVLDRSSGKPLPGIVVTATHEIEGPRRLSVVHGSRGKSFERLEADAEGRVEIEVPSGIALRVRASSDAGEAGSAASDLPALARGEVREITLRLPTGDDLPFWVQVVDETSRAPIAGASIEPTSRDLQRPRLVTDAQGLALHSGRSWQSTNLLVRAGGYTEAYVAPEAGHETASSARVLPLARSATLIVQVRDAAGAPIAGAGVGLTTPAYNLNSSATVDVNLLMNNRHWKAETDDAGRAVLSDLPSRVPLTGSVTRPRAWNPAEKIVLEPGETRTVTWSISGGVSLLGTVVDQDGRPVAQRQIWLRPAETDTSTVFQSYSGQPTRATTSDEAGHFRLEEVAPGAWCVGPSAPPVTERAGPDDVPALGQYVAIGSDASGDVEVVVHVDRGLFIRGRVLAPDGGVPQSASVQANGLDQPLHFGLNLHPNEGTFDLGPLMAGRYRVRAMGHAHAPSLQVEVRSGTEDVELRLQAGAKISGRLIAADGQSLPGQVSIARRAVEGGGVWMAQARANGFTMDGLDAGTYDVSAATSDGRVGVVRGIALGAGEIRTDVNVAVVPGGSVRVRHAGPARFVSISVLSNDVVVATDGVELEASRTFSAPVGKTIVRATYRKGGESEFVDREVEVRAGETVDVGFPKHGP